MSSQDYCTVCGTAHRPHDAFCSSCGQPLLSSSSTATGRLSYQHLLKQRYRILSQVGKGGFGAVYKAEDTLFGNRLVAVKEMSQRGLSTQETVEATRAFKQEALLLASLTHQHLPLIYDHFPEHGRWYLVMDFIEGETLEQHLESARGQAGQPGLPLWEVLDIGIQLCTVLDYLHTRQPPIIFRDLKLANVMQTPTGCLFLIDFGIARHFKWGQAKDTVPFGTPGYAAPEQYGKVQTTPHADIYSLGVTLHQLVSGSDPSRTPFQFAPLPPDGSPTLSELEKLLGQMLELQVEKRPASIALVKQELERLALQETSRPEDSSLHGGSVSSPPLSTRQSHLLLPTKGDSAPPGRTLFTYRGHAAPVITVAWSPDGQEIASASHDHTVQVWEPVAGGEVVILKHAVQVNAVAWSPEGARIASADWSGIVQVWDVHLRIAVLIYRGHGGPLGGAVNAVAWSPEGARIASAGNDHTVQIWDSSTGDQMCTYHGHAGWFQRVNALAWSPDGRHIASASDDQTVQVWEARTGRHVLTYHGHVGRVTSVAWSPDGKYLASGGDDATVQIWNVATSPTIFTYRGHASGVTTVAWSADGLHLASASQETVRIWDAIFSGSTVTIIKDAFASTGHTGRIRAVAWSPDGQRLASASQDRTVRVWQAV